MEIGIRRLEARPTADLCIDCKTRRKFAKNRWRANPLLLTLWRESLPPGSVVRTMTDSRYRALRPPSGELHFGSLIAALGSYLQARANRGIWRVRIEDIDPPREVPGAADTILRQLDHYGLHWDGDVLWQSQRHEAYREALTWLGEQGLSYYCTCTRARIHAVGGIYDGHCRDLGLGRKTPRCACAKPVRYCSLATVCAARSSPMSRWRERILLSTVATGCSPTTAVVVDDHFQGITEIVRGADLIEPTVRQISLYQHFGWQAPDYLHLPLALNGDGNKLSKQTTRRRCRKAIRAPKSSGRSAF